MLENLKELKEYIPATVAIITITAFLEKYFFFQYFNIPIYNYLEVDEYFTLSIETFIPFIILVSLGFGLIIITSKLMMKLDITKRKNLSYEKIKDHVFNSAFIPCFYLVIVTHQKISYMSFLYIGFLLASKWEEIILKDKKSINTWIWILFIFLGGIIGNAGGRVREIIEVEKQAKTILLLENKGQIELGKKLFKIDETKKYFFIYDKETTTTRVLERENIIDIFYKSENEEIQKLENEKLHKKNKIIDKTLEN